MDLLASYGGHIFVNLDKSEIAGDLDDDGDVDSNDLLMSVI